MNNQNLIVENKELKRQLNIARSWMRKQIKEELRCIKVEKETNEKIDDIEILICSHIDAFFSQIHLVNIPDQVLENILTSEMNYQYMLKWQRVDNLALIIWYNKALDLLIEELITKWFRKFVNTSWTPEVREDDSLDSFLNLVVNKWYSLNIWRLYHILKNIVKWKEMFWLSKEFLDYLHKYNYIKDILLNDKFIKKLEKLVDSDVLWEKRHFGKIKNNEALKIRKIVIWDFEDKNCIIYQLFKIQDVPL